MRHAGGERAARLQALRLPEDGFGFTTPGYVDLGREVVNKAAV
jgi:hypothetical protein